MGTWYGICDVLGACHNICDLALARWPFPFLLLDLVGPVDTPNQTSIDDDSY